MREVKIFAELNLVVMHDTLIRAMMSKSIVLCLGCWFNLANTLEYVPRRSPSGAVRDPDSVDQFDRARHFDQFGHRAAALGCSGNEMVCRTRVIPVMVFTFQSQPLVRRPWPYLCARSRSVVLPCYIACKVYCIISVSAPFTLSAVDILFLLRLFHS